MAESYNQDELLQSALSTAFSPVSVAPAIIQKPEPANEASHTPSGSEPLVSREELDKWEEERMATEARWKEESAVQRREAEERRAKIAAERAASGETWEKLEEGKNMPGPPNLLSESLQMPNIEDDSKRRKGAGYPDSPSPADVRDIVAGEPSTTTAVSGSRHEAQVSEHNPGLEHSQHWTEIDDVPPSMASSFPSLSYPENMSSSSPSEKSHSKAAHTTRSSRHTAFHPGNSQNTRSVSTAGSRHPPPSATLAIFDSRLSTRSRVIAFFSSLSINLLLPFVNGVMLGFGEIFARNMANKFFGWGVQPAPGIVATNVGIGHSKRK